MIRENLSRRATQTLRIASYSPRITATVVLVLFFLLTSLVTGKSEFNRTINISELKVKGDSIKTNSKIVSARIITSENKSGISGEVTEEKIVPSSTPAPVRTEESSTVSSSGTVFASPSFDSGLLSSVNSFRSANGGLPGLNSSGSLCDIASKRLNELVSSGSLDSHAGFNKYFQRQSEFNAMGEVIFHSSNQTTPDYAVNEGWAKSTAGHRENMLDAKWNYGCGATNGYFAVFNFGKK